MLKWMLIPGAMLWAVVVFWATLSFTFPSDHLADWMAFEVTEAADGAYELELGEVHPWWVGLSADSVSLWGEEPDDPEALDMALIEADNVSARVGLFSLLTRAPYIEAQITLGDAFIDASVQTTISEGEVAVNAVDLKATELDLMRLLSVAGGESAVVVASGTLDASLSLELDEGMESASGKAKISGDDMMLASLSVPMYGITDLELNVPIDMLDLKLKAKDGQMEVTKGHVRSGLADVEISGDIALSERVERSRLRLKMEVILNDWADTPLAPFRGLVEGAMASAKWDDGRYHYEVTGTLERYHFLPERQSRSRSSPSRSITRSPSGSTRAPAPTTSAERGALRDRLRAASAAAREASTAERPAVDDVITIGGPGREEDYPDDEEYDDEEFDDEEFGDEDLEREFEEMFEEGNLEDLLEEY